MEGAQHRLVHSGPWVHAISVPQLMQVGRVDPGWQEEGQQYNALGGF